MKKFCVFPKSWNTVSSDERKSKAAEILMEQLARVRGTSYQRISAPDKSERRRPAADFIYAEAGSGKVLALEYTEFTDPKVAEASALMERGKPLRRRGPHEVRPWEVGEEQNAFTQPTRSYPSDLVVLDKFIASKIKKDQLRQTQAHERILLIYDAMLMPESAFHRYQYRSGLTAAERDDVDHAFVILEQRFLYQLW